MTYDAVLAAMYVVLGCIFSLNFINSKYTIQNFPVLVGALLFGPIDGMLIGGIGELLTQMIRYGLEVSTPLWVMTYVISGLFTGLCAKKMRFYYGLRQMTITTELNEGIKKQIKINFTQILLIIIIVLIIVTAANTCGLFIYNKYIRGVPLAATFAAIPQRVILNILKSVIFAFVLPPVLKSLSSFAKQIDKEQNKPKKIRDGKNETEQ